MNERIRLLAEQATERKQNTVIDFVTYEMVPSNTYRKELNVEKFAELIVAECIAQCEQVATDADAMTNSKFVTDAGRMLHEGMWGGAKNCTAQIQTHFGVEE